MLQHHNGILLRTSGGLLARECCCTEPECCLYPWPDPDGTPLYPASDLPDELVFYYSSGTFTPNPVTLVRSGYQFFGDVSEGEFSWQFVLTWNTSLYGSAWVVREYFEGEYGALYYGPSECLQQTWGGSTELEDTFPDTLHFHQSDIVTADCELNRVSQCCWEGTLEYVNEEMEEVEVPISICYVAEEPSGDSVNPSGWPGKPCWILNYNGTLYSKEDPQSSPEGDYSYDRDGTMTVDTTP